MGINSCLRKVQIFSLSFIRYLVYFFSKKPKCYSSNETIQYIINNSCSLSRFGDGELALMMNYKHACIFQTNNDTLAKRLKNIIENNHDDVLICLPNIYKGELNKWTKEYRKHWRKKIFYTYYFCNKYFNKQIFYGDAHVSRFYMQYKNKDFEVVQNKISNLRKIWDQRSLLIVEGYSSRLGVGNDLFVNSLRIRRIICPNINAFDKYDEILTTTKNHYVKNDLVLLALGPTATVLAYDLQVKYSIQAIDIGHIDSEYEWFLRGCTKKEMIEGKHTAELPDNQEDYSAEAMDKQLYQKEILVTITD